ncbi:MAG: caspase family protein [Verrucomicrobia bacterium]|nr:caspase family protein [Verrucomicrobiota bacterium]
MSSHKALLIGAEIYGEGFASLPAVRHDIDLMKSAMETSGYAVELCPPDSLNNASELDALIRAFCSNGGPEDVHILYFTGHGLLADDVDCIIPAKTLRKDATVSPNQRVSTDLSKTIATSRTGLVLFIIDACRSREDVPATKGGPEWGDSVRIEKSDERRFIRLFGCAANQVCQTLTGDDPATSLFTRALAESISEGKWASLQDLLRQVEKRCAELLSQHSYLQPQAPHLSYGEITSAKRAVLEKPIFGMVGTPALRLWQSFDPDKLHCLVVTSEAGPEAQPGWGLKQLVLDALGGKSGQRIWESFVSGYNHLRLVSGKQRALPETFKPSSINFGSFAVIDAFENAESLDKAVRTVAEADLAVFDVTGFEPGVMLLIGIRSACRRSLSICSHGAGWQEGKPLEVPFNLQDININSHTARESRVGQDPVVERFVRRVETGFRQLSRHPRYQDLPAYDALRELGSEYEACSTIQINERILVLCSYVQEFFNNWRFMNERLKNMLWEKKNISPEIERIIDYGTSQLIWQSLYEQIRRTAACVVDWTGYSPSVFLELGVRLAVSEWGAIQVADETFLPGGARVPDLNQIERMRRLFKPIPYALEADPPAAFEEAVHSLLQRNPPLDEAADYNRIHRTLLTVIGTIQGAYPPVAEELKRRADSLHHPQQGREGAPQILFHGNRIAKQDNEKAALELRIAAWLYLEHRVSSPEIRRDQVKWELYRELGRAAKDALYDLGDDESLNLAEKIENRLNQMETMKKMFENVTEKQAQAKSLRKRGDAHRKALREDSALEAYRAGVSALNDALELLRPETTQLELLKPPQSGSRGTLVGELVETFGARGGLLKRLGMLEESLASYAEGAILENRFALPSTYNRLNTVKSTLLAGGKQLHELEPQIQELATLIKTSLDSDQSLSDSGWAWADLGDCMALLGNLDEARTAYSSFMSKAEIRSPDRALEVLNDIAKKLKESGDPDSRRLEDAIDLLKSALMSL